MSRATFPTYADEEAAAYREGGAYHDAHDVDIREYCYVCGEECDPLADDTILAGRNHDEYAHKACLA